VKRRIKKASVKFLSLVPKGANRLPVIYKEDGAFDIDMLVKAGDNFNEKGELLAVVYAPELRDSQGDIASADVIKDMMYDAAKNGVSIDIRHNEKALAKSDAYIAESFIIQPGDARFADTKDRDGNRVDVTGGWGVLVKIDNPELRSLYSSGEWQGISMGGTAVVQQEKEDLAAQVVETLINKLSFKTLHISGDIEMTGDELKNMLIENNKTLVEGFASVITKALEPKKADDEGNKDKKDDTQAAVLKFEGEPTVENLRKHRLKVAKAKALDGIDWTNPESIAKGEEAIRAIEAEEVGKQADSGDVSDLEKAAGITKEDSEEVKGLKLQLAKAQRRSNQDMSNGTPSDGDNYEKLGKEMADIANKSRE